MVLGEVVVSSAIAPIASVGSLSNTETKLVPSLVLTHNPPDAAPATISPVLSAATDVMRPVMLTLLPTTAPVKLAFSELGWGPIKLQIPLRTAGAATSAALAALAGFTDCRCDLACARAFFGIPNCTPRREAK